MKTSFQQKPHQPHDKFVHECLSVPELAEALLKQFCPADLVDKLAWNRLRIEKSEFKFANAQRRSAHACDMLFFIPREDTHNGGLHCHLEHYSTHLPPKVSATAAYRDAFFAAMHRKYSASIKVNPQIHLWQIILLQGRKAMAAQQGHGHNKPASPSWFPNGFFHQINPLATIIDLGAMAFAELQTPLPQSLFLLVAKAVRSRCVMSHLTVILDNLQRTEPFSHSEYLREVVLHYLPNGVAEIDKNDFFRTIRNTFSTIDSSKAMTLYESLINEGLQKGIERGIEQGIEQGIERGILKGRYEGRTEANRKTLILILCQRFGTIDESIRQQISSADGELCERWINRSLDAASLNQVFD